MWFTRLRTSMIIPSLIMGTILFLNDSGLGDGSGVGYPVAVAVNTVASLALLSGLSCLAGAWEGSRLQRGRLLEAPGSRPTWLRLAVPVLMAALPPAALACIRFLIDGLLVHQAGLLLLVTVTQFLAWAMVGTALGLALRRALSLPLSAAVPTLAVLFAPAQNAQWVRYLTGYWQFCCNVGETLNPSVLVPTLLTSATLALASLPILLRTCSHTALSRTRTSGASIGILALGLALACLTARAVPGDYGPTMRRSDLDLTCAQRNATQVCLWPEHRTRLDQTVMVVDLARQKWNSAGVETPVRASEATRAVTSQAMPLRLPFAEDSESLVLAVSMSRAYAPCQSGQAPVPTQVIDDQALATAWLYLVVNDRPPRPDVRSTLSPASWKEAAALRMQPTSVQTQRVRQALSDANKCQ